MYNLEKITVARNGFDATFGQVLDCVALLPAPEVRRDLKTGFMPDCETQMLSKVTLKMWRQHRQAYSGTSARLAASSGGKALGIASRL